MSQILGEGTVLFALVFPVIDTVGRNIFWDMRTRPIIQGSIDQREKRQKMSKHYGTIFVKKGRELRV